MMHDPRIDVHLIAMPKLSVPPQKRPLENDTADELTGLNRRTEAGKPLCWHFSMSKGCNNPVKAGRCRFGMHECIKCLKTGHGAEQLDMRPLQVGQQPFTKLTQARSVPHLGHPILQVSKPNQFHQMLAKFFAIQNPCERPLLSVIPT